MNGIKYRILLIEDDDCDQTAFKRMVKVEELPCDYAVAGSVSEARNILGSEDFDVVVADHSLGDGTAFDVLDLVKETPIIFVTGAEDEKVVIKAMKVGAYDYLPKDVERSYLKVLPYVMENAVESQRTKNELKEYHNSLEERTEQLAAEKELLSVTLSSMGGGVISVDGEKRIVLFNKVAENLTKWGAEEVQGKIVDEVFRLISEKNKKPVESPIDKVLSSGQIESGADYDILIARDGSECPISATAAPICRNDGTMIGIVMVFRDMYREQEIDRMKTDFISSVSHELRTPLTAIKAYTATILRDPDMPEHTRRKFLAIIDKESNRLARLIEDILDISKIESGNIRINRQVVDMVSVIDQVSSALEPLAEEKDIQLSMEIGDGISELPGDESKIQSVVTNLLTNAIKFTPKGGQVSVSVRNEGENVLICVSDTGIGIPKEALPKIFDRFHRVHRPGEQTQGTGLGLAIMKEIVSMHGGRIEVESEVNQGTTFNVFLPLSFDPISQAVAVN
jgi:PAS domain S-box-containing protein